MKGELETHMDIDHDVNETSKKKKRRKSKVMEVEGTDSLNGNIEPTKQEVVESRKRSSSLSENKEKKKKRKISNHDQEEKNDMEDRLSDDGEMENGEASNIEENSKETSKGTQRSHFSGKHFRASLNSANGLDMLRKFIKICAENGERDLASEYLLAGGSVLEILRLLETGEKKSIANAVTVFSAINILLVKILAQYPQYQTSAEEACRHLINSHLSHIHSMLSPQSNAKQRKMTLKLLAAIVSLGGNLPRDLLAQFHLQPETLDYLVQHTQPSDNQSVRTCFIHFVLAFLVEGKVPIIRALLDKRGVLSSIFPGLIYDSKDVICLVLTTIRTYVLENSGINKTIKLHVFSTGVVQNLVSLYNWKGPSNWPKRKKSADESNSEYLAEKEVVMDVVHNFLLVLLTSHRHGIVFHDPSLGISRAKHNQLVNTVLQSLDKPWEHEKPADLVIKILISCPDLIKSQLHIVHAYMEPRPSRRWIVLMEFLRKIVDSLDAETCLKTCSAELSANNLATAVTSLIMPGSVLRKAIIPSLTNESFVVRHEGILSLLNAFKRIHNFLLVVKTNDTFDFDKFKTHLTENICKRFPNLDVILQVWSKAFTATENAEADQTEKENLLQVQRHEHLNSILDLLHMYKIVCPELLNVPVNSQSNTLLNTLNELDDVDAAVLNVIKVKAIQLLLAFDPAEFSAEKETFSNALSYLIPLLYDDSSGSSVQAERAIETLLHSTGLFEGCADQIKIWIHSFLPVNDKDEQKELKDWFIDVVKKAVPHIKKYTDKITQAEETVSTEKHCSMDVSVEVATTDESENTVDTCSILKMQRSATISPLLYCVLHKQKKNTCVPSLQYISDILLHTLHYQVRPDCLLHLVKNLDELPIQKYLLSWSVDSSPIRVKRSISTSTICKFSSVLLSDEKISFDEIFAGDSSVTFQYRNENITINHSLSAYEVTCLFRMALFYLTQHATRGTLDEIRSYNCESVMISLLHIAKKLEIEDTRVVEECVKSVFTHPILLDYFAPFTQKKDSAKSLITHAVFDICVAVVVLYDKSDTASQFVHFKSKLLSQLTRLIAKRQRSDKVNNSEIPVTLLQLFELTAKNTGHLLTKLIELDSHLFVAKDSSDLSTYGLIVPKMLEISCSKRVKVDRAELSVLNAAFVSKLCTHLLYMKSNSAVNVDKWEDALVQYLTNYPYNIAGVGMNTFGSLLSTKISRATVNLISLLTSRKYLSEFANHIIKSELLKEASIVFSVIDGNSTFKWKQDFLQKLQDHYGSRIILYLTDPGSEKWIENNATAICYLVENSFDLAACKKVSDTVAQSGDKLVSVSVQYVQILQSVYNRYVTLHTDDETPIVHLIQVLLHIITLTLKKESKNVAKLKVLCTGLEETVQKLKERKAEIVLESLSGNHSWPQFTRFSLKLGLKETKDDKQFAPILKVLTVLCDIAYRENSETEYVKTLFEMTTSHSEFVNIMLGSSGVKRNLIELLWVLVRKNKTVMALSHVPLYLAAYGATLDQTDQLILLILQYYESNGVSVHEYRPYLWGNAAAIHYSVKDKTNVALWMQPTTTQVLNLLEKEIVANTIRNYPVHRGLKNPGLCEGKEVYDPAFYLPLLCFLLSENNVVSCNKFAVSGGLAMVFAACGSSNTDTRMAAYTVISRYYGHLEASNSRAKLLWMRLVDALRNGIVSLDLKLDDVQLSSIVSTFCAQTCLVATQPLNPLYIKLQSFLMAKPALDVKTIPELLPLFHSSDVQHKAHRHWILEIIRDGMKTERDMEVAFKCVLFKMLLDFYSCSLSDDESKKLILEIICATCKIPKAAILLVQGHGLLPWIQESSKDCQETLLVTPIIKIMNSLLDSLPDTKGEAYYRFLLLKTALSLMPRLTKDISIDLLALYTTVLQRLFASKHTKISATKEDLSALLKISKGTLDDVEEYEDMLVYGCKYVGKTDEPKTDCKISLVKCNLKMIVSRWCSQNRAS